MAVLLPGGAEQIVLFTPRRLRKGHHLLVLRMAKGRSHSGRAQASILEYT